MARVFPKSRANKRRCSVLAEFMHLDIDDALHHSRAERNKKKYNAYDICRKSFADGAYGGKDTSVHHERRHHMDANEIDEGIEYACLFAEHSVTPILMGEVFEGIRPVCSQADRPEGNDCKQKNAERGQLLADGERHEDHGRLHAPIGIVDRCVFEY